MGGGDGDEVLLLPEPRPRRGLASWALDLLERAAVRLGHDASKPLYWLSGNFAPVHHETPPAPALPVRGHLPVHLPYPILLLFFSFINTTTSICFPCLLLIM